jgi:hypothetical protein
VSVAFCAIIHKPHYCALIRSHQNESSLNALLLKTSNAEHAVNRCNTEANYKTLAYFPGLVRVFIYPNLIVICVPILAEIAHLVCIFSIITSTLLGSTLPTRRLIYIRLHLPTNYSVVASSLWHHILYLYSLFGDCFITVTRVRYVVHLSSN